MMVGVKVVDAAIKQNIGFKKAIVRDALPLLVILLLLAIKLIPQLEDNLHFVYALSVIGFVKFSWVVLEMITMLFNKKRRSLHDWIAGTVVLKNVE